MGNQNGGYQYYNHLQSPQVNNYAYPNSNHTLPPMFTLTQSAVIQNYIHQPNIPSHWPTGSYLSEQQYQQYQQNSNNFHYPHLNSNLNGNQQNQQVTQLSNNIHNFYYQNTPFNEIGLANNKDFNNIRNNNNIINNQQRVSNISQQALISNISQMPSSVSELQQSQPLLENNIIQSNIVRQDLVSNYQLGLHSTEQNSMLMPSILLNPVNQYHSMLKINKNPNQIIQLPVSNQIPLSLRLQKMNLKLAKDKFDVLSNDYEYHLFGILQQIQSQPHNGTINNDRLIYLLSIKRKFQKNIIEIRMKQQKLAKVLSQINTNSDSNSIQALLQNSNNSLVEMSYNNINQWRQIANSHNHPEFNYVVAQAKTHPHIMFSYNQRIKNQKSNVATSQFSVNSANNNLIIHGTLANSMKSGGSMKSSIQNSSHINMQRTAAFPAAYSSKVSQKSGLQSSKHQDSDFNQSSISLPQNNFVQQQNTPSNMYQTFMNKSSSNYPTILTKEPTKHQIPKIANFLQSKAVKPPPQYKAFIPLLPASDSF